METTLLSKLLCVIVWLLITGGFILFLCGINRILEWGKTVRRPRKGGWIPPS